MRRESETRGAGELRAWLMATGRTLESVARELGIPDSMVWGWAAGRRRPSLRYALAIERLTGIDAEAWL